jgi:hypothetical protein
MKIFVLSQYSDFDDAYSVKGVFSSEEKLTDLFNMPGKYDYQVQEFELDKVEYRK